MSIGIDNLKLVAKSGIQLGQLTATTFEDNKITLTEAFAFIPVLMGIPDLLKKKSEIKAEWKDLDTAERNEIKLFVSSELNIPNNPSLERKIEKGISLILDVVDFASEFKKPTTDGQ